MVYHIMKDGTMLTDIKGRIAKMSDVPTAYGLLEELNQMTGGKQNEKPKQRKKIRQRAD